MNSKIKYKNRAKISLLSLYVVLVSALCMAFVACGSRAENSTANSARIDSLRLIDDSISALAPSVLGKIERGLDSATDSMEYYEYLLRKATFYWLSDTPERADTLVDRIVAFVNKTDGVGRETIRSSYSSPRLNSLMSAALVCRAARNHNFHRNPETTVSIYNDAYRLMMQSDSKYNLPRTCANLADAYIQCNNLPDAAKWYRRALFLVDSLRLPEQENLTLYMGLAQIYVSLNDFTQARAYYDYTERYFDSMSPSMQAYYLNNLGNLYYFSKDYNRALATFLRMKQQLLRHGMQNKFDMYLCKLNLADVYLNLDSIDQSLVCLDEVEPFFLQNNDRSALYYCRTIRIGIATRRVDTAMAARLIADEKNEGLIPYSLVNIRNGYLMKFYEHTGNYRKAYDILRESNDYTDSLEHNRSNMRSAEIMARFTTDTLRLHHDLAMEHKNADLQHANFVMASSIAVAVAMVLLLAMWYMYTRKKSFENQLNVMHLKLNNVRNRISPHFMFNVLNNKILNSDQKEASELMELAKLIRANLDMSSMPSIQLDRELDFVNQYIRVERYLLGDDFSFSVDVAEDVNTSEVSLPSMFVQILAENAIVHGLKSKQGAKSLDIKVSRNGRCTIITVTDNGPGFNAGRAMRKGTGLGIISQTIAVVNERNSQKMRFNISNVVDADGSVNGCRSTLRVPDNMKY